MSSKNQLDLERYVPALLNFLSNKLSAGASQCYRENFGVGIVEWRVLSMLAVENHIPAQRICQVIGLDKAAVSRSLVQLEKEGCISSEVDARDARRYTVSLTPSGRALHDRVFVVAKAREQRLLADFSPEEVDILIDLLNRMHARLDEVNAFRPIASQDGIAKPQKRS
ncbi:MarR family winged helix-turn-helix transcriptional regulator [Rhodoferax sp.]|uniref:MarR family winged helix-turn-helix transcriptional regulator n=1 Tax=Rhodoferax sp. TaxID=50421 RepID=UPI00374DCD12